MEIVPSTFLALAAMAVLIGAGPYRGLWAFLGVAPFGAAAAFNLPAVGGATIGQVELTICALILLVLFSRGGPDRFLGTVRPYQPGFWLALMLGYCVVSTLFFPRIFEGQTLIFSLSRAVNDNGIITIPLRPSSGNITQTFLLILGSLCFFALATLYRVRPDEMAVMRALTVCTVVNFTLGWLDVITFNLGLDVLMEPIRTANYDIAYNHYMAGLKRMVGGMPEASSYGAFSLGLFGFWMHYWITGPRSRMTTVIFLMSTISVLRSTSSGAYVALVVLMGVYSLGWMIIARRGAVSSRAASLITAGVLGLWLSVIAVMFSYQMMPAVTEFFDDTLLNKLDSESGVERMSWNTQAMANFTDTYLLGAGLGSVRASNWFVSCLGSIGVIGTGLYLAFLLTMAKAPARSGNPTRDAATQSLKIGCLSQIVAALLTAPTPNIGTIFFIMAGLSVGLSRSAVVVAANVPVPRPRRRVFAGVQKGGGARPAGVLR